MVRKSGKIVFHQENPKNSEMQGWSYDPKVDGEKWGLTSEQANLSPKVIDGLIGLVRTGFEPFDILDSPQTKALCNLATQCGKQEPSVSQLVDWVAMSLWFLNGTSNINGFKEVADQLDLHKSQLTEIKRNLRALSQRRPVLSGVLNRAEESITESLRRLETAKITKLHYESFFTSALEEAGRSVSVQGERPDAKRALFAVHALEIYEAIVGYKPKKGQAPSFRTFIADFGGFGESVAKDIAKPMGF